MKTQFIEKVMKYDGQQLAPLFNYMQYKLLGDSCVSWIGPCDIPFVHMMDGEDLLEKSEIKGSSMLHFVFEIFDRELVTGVFLQRLFAAIVQSEILMRAHVQLRRTGDDLYLDDKKLSISIATRSANSVLVHFAMNISSEGTPVKTCCLENFGIDPKTLAVRLLERISSEYQDILNASYKVRVF